MVRSSLVCAVIFAPLAACCPKCPPECPSTKKETIRVCGSSTMGARLAPRLVAIWLNRPEPFEKLHHAYDPAGDCMTGRPGGETEDVEVCIRYRGSGDAIDRLEDQSCDVGMVSGPFDFSQYADLEPSTVGYDAIMIVASEDIEYGSISMETLGQWYSCQSVPSELTIWMRREGSSGTSRALQKSLGLRKELCVEHFSRKGAADAFGELIIAGGRWLYSISAQEQLNQSGFKVLNVQLAPETYPVFPTQHAIADRQYPLVRDLRLVINKKHSSPLALRLQRWATTEAARGPFETLFMTHVSSRQVDTAPLSESCRRGGLTYIKGKRVSSIYFDDGRSHVPSLSWGSAYLRANVHEAARLGMDVDVVGYASDDRATDVVNCRMARQRAESVRALAMKVEIPDGSARPVVRVFVGGPTRTWGARAADNRVAMVFLAERTRNE